jgi:hypothetical protein
MGGGSGGGNNHLLLCSICGDFPETVLESNCCFTIVCKICAKNCKTCNNCAKRCPSYKPNVPLQRIVDQLDVVCPNSGCQQTVKHKELNNHLSSCGYGKATCFDCEQEMNQKDMESHLILKCPMRPIPCPNEGCNHWMSDGHLPEQCGYLIVCCQHCNQQMLRKDLQKHTEVHCEKAPLVCPFGCSCKILRSEMEKHINCSVKQHMRQLVHSAKEQQTELKNLRLELNLLKSRQQRGWRSGCVKWVEECGDSIQNWFATFVQNPDLRGPQINLLYFWFIGLFCLLALNWRTSFNAYGLMSTFIYTMFMGYSWIFNTYLGLPFWMNVIGNCYFLVCWAVLSLLF